MFHLFYTPSSHASFVVQRIAPHGRFRLLLRSQAAQLVWVEHTVRSCLPTLQLPSWSVLGSFPWYTAASPPHTLTCVSYR